MSDQGRAIQWYILQYVTWHHYPELRYDQGYMYLFVPTRRDTTS